MVMAGAAPGASAGLVHVTVPVVSPQVQPAPEAPEKTAEPGRLSETLTDVAVLGPALATASVYVTSAPAPTGSGASLIASERSATGVTVVCAVDVLSEGSGSAVAGGPPAGSLWAPPFRGAPP